MDSNTAYVYGPDGLPLEQLTASGTVYYHHDQLGSTRALTNGSGTVVASYTYDPYGNLTASTGTVANPFGYAGQYTDTETGYQYLRNRYYDPATAQFLTRDPLVAITRAPYSYADGNPLNETDPLGLFGHPGRYLAGHAGQISQGLADVALGADLMSAGFPVVAPALLPVGLAAGALSTTIGGLQAIKDYREGNTGAAFAGGVGAIAGFFGTGAGIRGFLKTASPAVEALGRDADAAASAAAHASNYDPAGGAAPKC